MTTDALTVSLPSPLSEEVRAAAAAQDISPEEYVRRQVVDGLAANDLDWAEDVRRLEEGGDNIPLDDAFDRFKSKVAAARANAK